MQAATLEERARGGWLRWVAWLTLLAGLLVGALALAAPAGVWIGAWDFQRGFALLAIANTYADVVALTAVAIAVALFVLARVLRAGNGARLAALALIGALAAGLGYWIPESYRPPADGSIPPIHDISTDSEDPPEFVAVLPLRAGAPNTTEYGGSPDMTPARLAELTRQAYPDLQTVQLDVPPAVAFDRALGAAEALGWELVAQEPDEGRIEATDTTFWFRFKDDIVIRIRPADGGSEVDARSVSRVGRGDVGTNARRLRRFFAALEER